MNRNAAAIVVGIDHYDDAGIPQLSGGLHDAKLAAAWLLAIGVPAENIFLHISPAADASPADFPGIAVNSAEFASITKSFDKLANSSGDQLFLFLSGHGLNVPGALGGPIFLAQDYGSGTAASQNNMRMFGFIQWMVSWSFRDQFLFYDACQNPTTSVGRVSLVKAVDPPMLDALPVAPVGGMLACFSASPGQKAWAGNGDGVLVRHVLDQLDSGTLAALPAEAQVQDSIIYDWETGARSIDMRKLFQNIIAPEITEEAATAGNRQNPLSLLFGTAGSQAASPILELVPEETANFEVHLRPVEAASSVKKLRLSIQTPSRNGFLPAPGVTLPNPLQCKGPASAEVVVSCTTRPENRWRVLNSPQKATLGPELSVVTINFDDQPPERPPGPPAMFNIRVSGADGEPHYPLGGAYERIAQASDLSMGGVPGLEFNHHEHGPDIGFDPGVSGSFDLARTAGRKWLRAIRDHLAETDLSVSLFPPGVDPEGKRPNFALELNEHGAIRLAGFLTDIPSIDVTLAGADHPVRSFSPSDAERHRVEWIEPGAYRVTIDLPWGRWSHLVSVKEEGPPTICALPEGVGREPLRNSWMKSHGDAAPPPPSLSLGARISGGLPLNFGLLGQEVDGDDRVEPFSRTKLAEWDLLFSAGRLDRPSAERIEELAGAVRDDLKDNERSLLMLGLGHVAVENSFWSSLRIALAQVEGPLKRSLDYALLDQRLRAESGSKMQAATQAENIMRSAIQSDASLAPPIVLVWSASLLSKLFADAQAHPPLWLTRLSANSILAVRTRADAATEREVPDEVPAEAASAAVDPEPVGRRLGKVVTYGHLGIEEAVLAARGDESADRSQAGAEAAVPNLDESDSDEGLSTA